MCNNRRVKCGGGIIGVPVMVGVVLLLIPVFEWASVNDGCGILTPICLSGPTIGLVGVLVIGVVIDIGSSGVMINGLGTLSSLGCEGVVKGNLACGS